MIVIEGKQAVYTEQDYKEVNKSLNKFIIIYSITTILFIAAVVLLCVNWGDAANPLRAPKWMGYVISGLWAIGTVFSWGMFGSRIIHYRKFLYDIKVGLDREVDGIVMAVDADVSLRQGLEFYGVNVDVGSPDPDDPGRRLYYDAAKGQPQFTQGQRIRFTVFGNFIKLVEIL